MQCSLNESPGLEGSGQFDLDLYLINTTLRPSHHAEMALMMHYDGSDCEGLSRNTQQVKKASTDFPFSSYLEQKNTMCYILMVKEIK